MRELRNSFDKEIAFESLEEAKKYYTPSNLVSEREDFLGTDEEYKKYCVEVEKYKCEILEAENLGELAEVLTKWTDIFGNGSVYFVFEWW